MSKRLIVYGIKRSPTVQAVLFALAELQLDYEFRRIRLTHGEHLTDDYIQKNPAHTIPTLEDNGHYIGDSHAILQFLVDKYAPNDQLYPKELYIRAKVNQLLFYSNTIFLEYVKPIFAPMFKKQSNGPTKEQRDNLEMAYTILERFFINHNLYIACNHLTIADFSFVPIIFGMNAITPIDQHNYPKLFKWFATMTDLPSFQDILVGLQTVFELIPSKL